MQIPSFLSHIGAPTDPVENEQRIETTGRISYVAYKASAGALFGVAVVAVILRLTLRLSTRRRLFLDDAFLIIGLVTLAASAALMYVLGHNVFLIMAVRSDPSVKATLHDFLSLVDSLAYIYSFLCVSWTSIFAVKAAFLALFRMLIAGTYARALHVYFWVVSACTAVGWVFMIGEAFAMCPYFGNDSIKCFPEPDPSRTLAVTVVVTSVDVVTDLLIVSIPILLLGKSRMKRSEKISLCLFLCLSLVMVIVAITRIAGYRLPGIGIDMVWEVYWQHVESCVSVIMGAVAACRSIIVRSGSSQTNGRRAPRMYNPFQKATPNSSGTAGSSVQPDADGFSARLREKPLPSLPRFPRRVLTSIGLRGSRLLDTREWQVYAETYIEQSSSQVADFYAQDAKGVRSFVVGPTPPPIVRLQSLDSVHVLLPKNSVKSIQAKRTAQFNAMIVSRERASH